jgi:hypothetical protein
MSGTASNCLSVAEIPSLDAVHKSPDCPAAIPPRKQAAAGGRPSSPEASYRASSLKAGPGQGFRR